MLSPDSPRFTMVAATDERFRVTHTGPETLGRGLFEVFPDNPDDRTATGTSNLRASLERVLRTGAADTMAVQKYDIRGPDGTFQVKYWSPRNVPILAQNGDVQFIVHRVEDVTELVQATKAGEELRGRTREMEREVLRRSEELASANQSLRDANARLAELDAIKTAFFSNISHEFRTPLTLMLGPLEDSLTCESEPLTETHRQLIRLAHANALRLLKLVNALLNFSRIEAGRARAHFAPLNLSAFTAELAGMFQSAMDRANVTLVVECATLSGPCWVDRDMWEKIVTNLVSNAFKFTFEGSVTVRVSEGEQCVALEVRDTGVGIPEAELPKVFERFHRVAGNVGRTYEGSGIGLSLVRDLVELHGGRVSVESVVGVGTAFRVEIPKGFAHLPAQSVFHDEVDPSLSHDSIAHALEVRRWVGSVPPPAAVADASSQREAVSSSSRAPSTPSNPDHRASVLVVDDNADLREYIAGLLRPLYEVAVASDGQEALAKLGVDSYDIVVSDVMMPRLDGLGLLREIRATPRLHLLPVILLSARSGEEAAIEGLSTGADDYLVKPFSARELIARVRTHVEIAHTRKRWVDELEQANRELDWFTYAVSHDLRAPLRAILGFAQALKEDHLEQLDAEGQQFLGRVQQAGDQMAELLDALFQLAHISKGELAWEEVDLSELARDVGQHLQHSLGRERNVQFVVQDSMRTLGDRGLLRVVMENLIGNAFKFTGKVAQAHIEVSSRETAEDRVFMVRDNGAGFDPAFAEKLFMPFQRLHSAREFTGSGVGLTTVHRIVRRHGGRLWADGAPDQGATFSFTVGQPGRLLNG